MKYRRITSDRREKRNVKLRKPGERRIHGEVTLCQRKWIHSTLVLLTGWFYHPPLPMLSLFAKTIHFSTLIASLFDCYLTRQENRHMHKILNNKILLDNLRVRTGLIDDHALYRTLYIHMISWKSRGNYVYI